MGNSLDKQDHSTDLNENFCMIDDPEIIYTSQFSGNIYTDIITIDNFRDLENHIGPLSDHCCDIDKWFPKGTKLIVGDESNKNKYSIPCKRLFITPHNFIIEKIPTIIFRVVGTDFKRLEKLEEGDTFSVTDPYGNYWHYPQSNTGKCIYVL